jgi:phytoene desaturase
MFESGGHICAAPDLARLQAQVARLSPADAAALPRFMADNRAKLQAFRTALQAAFNGWRDLLRPDMLKALPMMRPWRSVDGDLAEYFKDERVRPGFSFQSKYLGMSPYRCPSLFTILSCLEYEFGVWCVAASLAHCSRAACRYCGCAAHVGVPALPRGPQELRSAPSIPR